MQTTLTATRWLDELADRFLTAAELTEVRHRARRLYEANAHIFEDELDALAALGVVPAA